MKILISPAKSLTDNLSLPELQFTQPQFLEEATTINVILKKKSVKALGQLMSLSDNLSQLNWQRNQDFQLPFTTENARPAVYTFNGDVYQGLDVATLAPKHLQALQSKLRILSGLFGVLRPLDLIQPYRLEMGTGLGVRGKKDLYAFWKSKIAPQLNSELEEGALLVNLASNEYFKAVDTAAITAPVVTPQFKDFKNGKLKIISFYAKKARGRMARFLIENECTAVEDLQAFAEDGYTFSASATADAMQPVFVR